MALQKSAYTCRYHGHSGYANSLGILVPVGVSAATEYVKLSFFGNIDNGRVSEPEVTADWVMLVAPLVDMMAHKLKVILQRIEAKDYRDIAAMLKYGRRLDEAMAGACALFGKTFQPKKIWITRQL
jgi:hypothetical protein